MDANHRKIIEDIEQFGWHVIKVMPEEDAPGFAYTIGLQQSFDHPEVLISGLDLDLMHALLNLIGEDIQNGRRFTGPESYDGILTGFDVYFRPVDSERYLEYLGIALDHYKSHVQTAFHCLQCIWPSAENGAFPWDEHYPEELIGVQELLYEDLG